MSQSVKRLDATSSETVFKMGELFSGPGGLAIGAQRAESVGGTIVHQWSTDYDLDTCRTYGYNVVGDPNASSVLHKDIRSLDFEELSAHGDIDALSFGFPCNDFSLVGERKALNGDFGPLYKYGIKALNRFQPKWFLAENVGGIRADGGSALRQIFAEMEQANYVIYPHYYKFEQYGVPQARHRMIVVGIRKDLDIEFRVPSAEPFSRIDVSARKALADIPLDAKNQEATRHAAKVIERLNWIPEGGNAWSPEIPVRLRINTNTTLSSIYRRLVADRPAYTVTGGGGGGTHMYHWTESRALTNRERARLQTFPDDFVFQGKKESVRRQVGMAVPPKGARVIFEAILNSFAGVDYPWVSPSLVEFLPQKQAEKVSVFL
jgi:DNA (cytosine-5)-methyltransferase 1